MLLMTLKEILDYFKYPRIDSLSEHKGSFSLRARNKALFVSLNFPRLKSKRALSEAKKSTKEPKNTPFHACS